MHEMSIAVNIVEIAEKYAVAEGGAKISCIELEVGALAGVLQESLAFCFESAALNTLAEGAQLQMRSVEGRAKCLECRKFIVVERYGIVCPQCSGLLEIVSGEELNLQAIIIDE